MWKRPITLTRLAELQHLPKRKSINQLLPKKKKDGITRSWPASCPYQKHSILSADQELELLNEGANLLGRKTKETTLYKKRSFFLKSRYSQSFTQRQGVYDPTMKELLFFLKVKARVRNRRNEWMSRWTRLPKQDKEGIVFLPSESYLALYTWKSTFYQKKKGLYFFFGLGLSFLHCFLEVLLEGYFLLYFFFFFLSGFGGHNRSYSKLIAYTTFSETKFPFL